MTAIIPTLPSNSSLYVCTVLDCGYPADIANGFILGPNSTLETKFGSVVQYACNEGHYLVGMAMRTCLESGTWSGPTTCEGLCSLVVSNRPYTYTYIPEIICIFVP